MSVGTDLKKVKRREMEEEKEGLNLFSLYFLLLIFPRVFAEISPSFFPYQFFLFYFSLPSFIFILFNFLFSLLSSLLFEISRTKKIEVMSISAGVVPCQARDEDKNERMRKWQASLFIGLFIYLFIFWFCLLSYPLPFNPYKISHL